MVIWFQEKLSKTLCTQLSPVNGRYIGQVCTYTRTIYVTHNVNASQKKKKYYLLLIIKNTSKSFSALSPTLLSLHLTTGYSISSGNGENEMSNSVGMALRRFDNELIDSRQSSTHEHKTD